MNNTFILLWITVLARQVTCTGYPTLQWDPDTAKDCVEWYNNSENETCEAVRKLFGITPEEFHLWNPSVGLDCQPWDYQSYCIVTQEKLNKVPTTTTPFSITATTTISAATLVPSPTSWTTLGCYVQDNSLPILEEKMSPADGDTSLTIPSCEDSCYLRSYGFAGVQDGNQCWCGSYVGGEWTSNQTDCNTPCTGDKDTICGGKGFLNIFKAQENQPPTSSTGHGTQASTSTSTGVNAASGSQTAMAVRSMVMWWKF